MVTMTSSKVKSRSHHDVAHLQPLTNVPTKYQLPTPYGFQDIAHHPRNSPDKFFKLVVTMTSSKVKSRSHHDITHLQPQINVPTKYQLSVPYCFRDIARTGSCRSRSPRQLHQKSLQGVGKMEKIICPPPVDMIRRQVTPIFINSLL